MPGDRKQFERARTKWEALHAAKQYSLPEKVGRIAVICSYITDIETPLDQQTKTNEFELAKFKREADDIACLARLRNRQAEVILNAQGTDVIEVLQDPTISSIVTIGHGSLSYLYMPYTTRNRRDNNRFDWRDVSAAADHLKLGCFIQRHCGHSVRALSVPLGAFSVSHQSNVVAPVDQFYNPSQLFDHKENEKLIPVTSRRSLSYNGVKKEFPYDEA